MANKYRYVEVADVAPGWRLFRREEPGQNGWYGFVLRPVRGNGTIRRKRTEAWPKRSFHAAHNGVRFSDTRDLRILDEYHPGVRDAASAVAARAVAEQILAA